MESYYNILNERTNFEFNYSNMVFETLLFYRKNI